MSKDYKGALYYLMTETAQLNGNKVIPIAQNAIDDLEELVKRNEPMKPLSNGLYGFGKCECGHIVNKEQNYCSNCGQRLDWKK